MVFLRTSAMLVATLVLFACTTVQDPRVAALEKRVQQRQDEKAIREVVIRYGEYLDARDYAAYASLFASDGVWTGGFGSATGPAAIQQMLEKNLGKPEQGFVNKANFHLMTTVVVDVDGDTAKARSRYAFFSASPGNRPTAVLAGRYVDEFVRAPGQADQEQRSQQRELQWRYCAAPSAAASWRWGRLIGRCLRSPYPECR